jgi:hypothetical protein
MVIEMLPDSVTQRSLPREPDVVGTVVVVENVEPNLVLEVADPKTVTVAPKSPEKTEFTT